MGINNFKKYKTLLLTTALCVLTGCSYTGNAKIDKKDTITSETTVSEQLENSIPFSEIVDVIKERNVLISFKKGFLSLKSTNENGTNTELSDDTYQLLNEILSNSDMKKLYLHKIGNEIDFSRLNLSNIKSITLTNCKENLDCAPLAGEYEFIEFNNTPVSVAVNLLENSNCSNTIISCQNMDDTSLEKTFMDIDFFAQHLIENNIEIDSLYVAQSTYGAYISKETIEKLCKVNTNRLRIESSGNDEIIDLDITLNKSIEQLSLRLDNENESKNGELGNITIRGYHPISIVLSNIDIIENTHFDLQPESNITIRNAEYTDITPFNDLRNMELIVYYAPESMNPIVYSISQSYNYEESFGKFMEQLEELYQSEKGNTYIK